ncbi:unnamed protein product [Acanthoscelides obtectus]|uniref:Uncharacterized protein n=1 Tax=Acanthoscelides obtectus TaxID=200917 RepID=A0A9P0VS61_ACAOB|nr:unnamed protein product [Acanthoscelides obtectus]CAK1626972.1 Vacuolar protein sorting-associated protein 13B [Acanthoscelides obtectus]
MVSPSQTTHKDSSSGKTASKLKKPDNADSDSIKLTAWVQWTITRFTIELLSNECNTDLENDLESQQPMLKLVVDAEDIVSSLDLQSVYLKIKSKIGSASIQHFKRATASSKWMPGPFSGAVMRQREDVVSVSSDQQQLQQQRHHEDNGFMCVTITRASCQHTHTLWGAGGTPSRGAQGKQGAKEGKKASTANLQAASMLSPSRYITEIVVNVQPTDFVISLNTLRSFYLVIAPLLEIPLSSEPAPLTSPSSSSTLLQTVNSQVLPLAYLECQDIRVVMPSVELGSTGAMHDVIILQVQKISLTPSAVNPICRTPIRQDIYDQAVHARILNIPGSEVEDRQYQFDMLGISISTGTWDDIDAVFSPTGTASSTLHPLSENPALEWNNLEQGHPYFHPIMNLWNVTDRFDISVVAAPAILYKSNTLVCGHSVEINFVSDIVVNLSLNQIKLVSAILSEFASLVEPLLLDDSALARPKIIFPYSRFEPSVDNTVKWDPQEIIRDSGIDTSDIKSVKSSSRAALKGLSEREHQLYSKKHSSVTMVYTAAPVDVLFTAGKIGLSLYQIDDGKPNIYKQKKKKRPYKIDPDDLGYEAEEESVEDKEPKKYNPLMDLALERITNNLTLSNRPEKVSVVCGLHSVTLNVISKNFKKILLNPWTVTFNVSMFWESWQTTDSSPQVSHLSHTS